MLFVVPGEFVDSIFANIFAYCDPLKMLLKQFHSALHDAHKSHSSDGLYDKVVDVFTKAEAKGCSALPANFTDAYSALEKAEEERRLKDNKVYWDVHSPLQKASQGPMEHQMLQQRVSPSLLRPPPSARQCDLIAIWIIYQDGRRCSSRHVSIRGFK